MLSINEVKEKLNDTAAKELVDKYCVLFRNKADACNSGKVRGRSCEQSTDGCKCRDTDGGCYTKLDISILFEGKSKGEIEAKIQLVLIYLDELESFYESIFDRNLAIQNDNSLSTEYRLNDGFILVRVLADINVKINLNKEIVIYGMTLLPE